MSNTLLKVAITLVALIVLCVRFFKPELKVDSAVVTLIVMAVVPWLSSLVKGVELFGIKIEFQETAKSPQPEGESSQPQSVPSTFHSADDYFSRLLKYTPLEPIVGFIVASAMIPVSTLGSRALWAVFFGFLLITFAYSRFFLRARIGQTLILSLGFAVWVFAIGGPFATFPWYQRLYGGLVLALFTFITPLFIV